MADQGTARYSQAQSAKAWYSQVQCYVRWFMLSHSHLLFFCTSFILVLGFFWFWITSQSAFSSLQKLQFQWLIILLLVAFIILDSLGRQYSKISFWYLYGFFNPLSVQCSLSLSGRGSIQAFQGLSPCFLSKLQLCLEAWPVLWPDLIYQKTCLWL